MLSSFSVRESTLLLLIVTLSSQAIALPSSIAHRHAQIHARREADAQGLSSVHTGLAERAAGNAAGLGWGPSATYASSGAIVTPVIKSNNSQQQRSSSQPQGQFFQEPLGANINPIRLPLAVQQENSPSSALSTQYGMDPSTGVVQINATNQNQLQQLACTPEFTRDGGKGGYLAGKKLFIFADTTVTAPCSSFPNHWSGFASTSIAMDSGNNAATGKGITLQDPSGELSSNIGTPRGFIPFTLGESAFSSQNNASMRYAIWPNSNIIPADGTSSAYLFSPIVFMNGMTETYAGNTLVQVSFPDGTNESPVAERVGNYVFQESEPEFGNIGGFRSFSSGPGTNDGKIYIWATVPQQGLYLARTDASNAANRNSYEFYTGDQANPWSPNCPSKTSVDQKALFQQGDFVTVDIFYSPRHLTFLMVYQKGGFDSNIYWKYLQSSSPILPSWNGGSEQDIGENIYKGKWVDQGLLFTVPPGTAGRAYNGGNHPGYYEGDDIVNGGSKMLLTWIAPSGNSADVSSSGGGDMHWSTTVEFE